MRRPLPLVLAVLALTGVSAPARGATARPDLPARVALVSGWLYRPDAADRGTVGGWFRGARRSSSGWRHVTLPHVFDTRPAPGLFRGTVGWYSLTFRGPATPPGLHWAVAFEQVRRRATVWLNGRPVGTHDDPYAPFELSLAALRPGAANTLVVRVDNRKGAAPREGWWNWGGIPRAATLVSRADVELSHPALLTRMRCEPGGACATPALTLDAFLSNSASKAAQVVANVTVAAPAGGTGTRVRLDLGRIGPRQSRRVKRSFALPAPVALWSPDHPSLYAARIATSAGGRPVALDTSRFGVRTVSVAGGLLFLNGHRLNLRGASIEEDAAGHGPALTGPDMDRLVAELHALHANVTRAQYLLNPRLLERLDRAGIMVWSQAPIYHRDAQLTTAPQRAAALQTLRATVLEARIHPAVLTHSVANELTPEPDRTPSTRSYLLSAAAAVRDLDPSVPVALDLLSYPGYPRERSYQAFDVLGINNYFGWYPGQPGHRTAAIADLGPFLRQTHARYPDRALVMTEFGAEANVDGGVRQKQTYAFQEAYVRQTLAIVGAAPFISGAIYWTLREFAVKPYWNGGANRHDIVHDSIHHKGLLSYTGRPKPAFATAARLFAATPLYVPGGAGSQPAASAAAVLALLALAAAIGGLAALALWSFREIAAARGGIAVARSDNASP